jgi:hypothetical protein
MTTSGLRLTVGPLPNLLLFQEKAGKQGIPVRADRQQWSDYIAVSMRHQIIQRGGTGGREKTRSTAPDEISVKALLAGWFLRRLTNSMKLDNMPVAATHAIRNRRIMPKQRSDVVPGLTCCGLCKAERDGRVYEFWSGYREKFREDRLYDRKTRVSYTYSDLKPFQVFVCNRCAARLRRQHYLVKFIVWSVVTLPCLVVLAIVPFLRMDRLSGYLCLGAVAVPTAAALPFCLTYAWQMIRPVPANSVTDRVVLLQIRAKKEYGKKGHDFFTPAEYAEMFER